jgi:hypothetical protein
VPQTDADLQEMLARLRAIRVNLLRMGARTEATVLDIIVLDLTREGLGPRADRVYNQLTKIYASRDAVSESFDWRSALQSISLAHYWSVPSQ